MRNFFKIETKYVNWDIVVTDRSQISNSVSTTFNLSELIRAHLDHLIDDLKEFEKENQEELDQIGK